MKKTRLINDEQGTADFPEALKPGTKLDDGKFNIVRFLGQGGFGITYLARDLRLQRDVVIKECFPESICMRHGENLFARSAKHEASFRKTVRMFIQEAQRVASLTHPNIVNVHYIFEENETAYMVLDLIKGPDLFEVIDDPVRQLRPPQVLAILTKILDALDLIHFNNLLHRDIAPDNILLDKFDNPTLIDFGAAGEFAIESTKQQSTLMMVKDGYSPFEFYVSGAKHQPSSDLYALGATIYHLLTNEAPTNSQERQSDVLSGKPDPCVPLVGRVANYSNSFLAAVDQAMAVSTTDRFQSAREWLDQLGKDDSMPANVPKPDPKRLRASLGNLVSETNKHVMDAPPQPSPVRKSEATAHVKVDKGPAWRDEFNRESSDVLDSPQQYETQDYEDAYTPDNASSDPKSKAWPVAKGLFRRMGRSKKHDDDFDDDFIDAPLIYRPARRKRKSSFNEVGLQYIGGFIGFAVLATFIAVNQDQMRDEGSLSALFSFQGFCRNETFMNIFPDIDCTTAQSREATTIDLNDRDRILDPDWVDPLVPQ